MRVGTVFFISTALMIVAMAAPSLRAADGEVWQLAPRPLPPPAAASDALRDSIAATPQPDVERAHQYPQSRAEWESAIAARAKARAVSFEALEQRFGVAIERGEISGVHVYRVVPAQAAPVHREHVFLYVHGGGYIYGGGDGSVGEAPYIAGKAGIDAIAIDYRMPPADPFPAAVDDVVAVYRDTLEHYAPGAIAIGGSSAGGGLTLAAVHRFKALGLPMPGAIYAGTPWADLTKTGDSLYVNEGVDRALVTYDGWLDAAARLYADGHDLKDPLLSPLYGDFTGFPPTYLVTGTRDLFLSNTVRTHRKLRQAGVVAELNVYEGMSHAGYAFNPDTPEARQVYSELAAFLEQHLR
jgi:epsilon-lactone hydrolase